MNRTNIFAFLTIYGLAAGLGYFFDGGRQYEAEDAGATSYILQGRTTDIVADAVRAVDGEVTHEFTAISAVAAYLNAAQHEELRVSPAIVSITEDADTVATRTREFDKRIM